MFHGGKSLLAGCDKVPTHRFPVAARDVGQAEVSPLPSGVSGLADPHPPKSDKVCRYSHQIDEVFEILA